MESIGKLKLERMLEDHELVADAQSMWPKDMEGNTWLLRKWPTKYSIVPPFVEWGLPLPRVQGNLHVRTQPQKPWAVFTFVLDMDQGLCVVRQHFGKPQLKQVVPVKDHLLYVVMSQRNDFDAPTDLCFCLKPRDKWNQDSLKARASRPRGARWPAARGHR